MSSRHYRFVLVLRSASNVVHEEELDFNSLIHDVAFSAVCKSRLPNDGRWEPIRVEPVWIDHRLEAVMVSVAGCSRTYGRRVFRDRAIEVLHSKDLLDDRQSDDHARVSWDVEVRTTATEEQPARRRPSVRRQAYPLIGEDVNPSTKERIRLNEPGSVFVTAALLAELREESANSLDRERADFLVGRLVQRQGDDPAVVLTDRVPAEAETRGSLVQFSFSSRTFQAAQREIEQRGKGHVILGWHHNHPPPCGRKCLMTVPACRTENVMLSLDDRIVHRSAFGRPYMVALVSGKGSDRRADDPLIRAYGWRRGLICEKDWAIVPGAAHA